jgi:hypothetical protein
MPRREGAVKIGEALAEIAVSFVLVSSWMESCPPSILLCYPVNVIWRRDRLILQLTLIFRPDTSALIL